MHLKYRNVNTAFRGIVQGIHEGVFDVRRSPSRNGEVIRIAQPVIVTYENPKERVLFNQARDAPCFFSLFESLYFLAGRNDLAPLQYYISDYGKFSDDGKTLNGAYGHRWRAARAQLREHPENVEDAKRLYIGGIDGNDYPGVYRIDQLQILIDHLKAVPDSRRAVLRMWGVESDLLKIGFPVKKSRLSKEYFATPQEAASFALANGYPDGCIRKTGELVKETDFGKRPYYIYDENATEMSETSKDVCCNLSAVFEIREENENQAGSSPFATTGRYETDVFVKRRYLDMTVFNRSNDIILGMLGANAVHFSFLLEYMACCLGVEVGQYHQVSSNAHVYTWNWKPEEWLADSTVDWYTSEERVKTIPLVQNQDVFDKEVRRFIDHDWADAPTQTTAYQEPFLRLVAEPMCRAFHYHKERQYDAALSFISNVHADDWRIAGTNWINKRRLNWEQKQCTKES